MAAGNWNGVAITAWNGAAVSSWNGTSISAGSSFAPSDVAGLVAWYDAANAASIGSLSADDPIGTWTNLASTGSGFNLASSGTARPLYKTAVQNGLAVARFAGTDDVMNCTPTTGYSDVTMFAVMKVISLSGDQQFFGVGDTSVNGSGRTLRRASGVNFLGWTGNGAGWTVTNTTHSTDAGGAFHVVGFVQNGTALQVIKDGQSQSKTIGTTPEATTNQVFVAYNGATQTPANIDVGEMVVYNAALSSGDWQAVVSYLGAKWGISVSF
jgi:hypothetical protein